MLLKLVMEYGYVSIVDRIFGIEGVNFNIIVYVGEIDFMVVINGLFEEMVDILLKYKLVDLEKCNFDGWMLFFLVVEWGLL